MEKWGLFNFFECANFISGKVQYSVNSKFPCFLARQWPQNRDSITSGSLSVSVKARLGVLMTRLRCWPYLALGWRFTAFVCVNIPLHPIYFVDNDVSLHFSSFFLVLSISSINCDMLRHVNWLCNSSSSMLSGVVVTPISVSSRYFEFAHLLHSKKMCCTSSWRLEQ